MRRGAWMGNREEEVLGCCAGDWGRGKGGLGRVQSRGRWFQLPPKFGKFRVGQSEKARLREHGRAEAESRGASRLWGSTLLFQSRRIPRIPPFAVPQIPAVGDFSTLGSFDLIRKSAREIQIRRTVLGDT